MDLVACAHGNLQAASTRNADTFEGGVVSEPADLVSGTLVDQTARQGAALLGLENALENVALAGAGSDKGNLCAVEDDGQAQGDALWRGLGRVGDAEDPGVGFAQQRVLGEEGAGVAVGAAAEEHEVEEGQLDRVAGSKDGDERLFVLVGALLGVVEVFFLDGVDLGRAELSLVNLVQQLVLEQSVVAVLVVQRHAALVGEEDFPLVEVDRVGGAAVAFGQQCLGERLGQRTTRDSDSKGAVTLDSGLLLGEDVLAQGGSQFGNAGKAVDVGRLAHGGCVWRVDCRGDSSGQFLGSGRG